MFRRQEQLVILFCREEQLVIILCREEWLVIMLCREEWFVIMLRREEWLVIMLCREEQLVIMFCKEEQLVIILCREQWLVIMLCREEQLVIMFCCDNVLQGRMACDDDDDNNQMKCRGLHELLGSLYSCVIVIYHLLQFYISQCINCLCAVILWELLHIQLSLLQYHTSWYAELPLGFSVMAAGMYSYQCRVIRFAAGTYDCQCTLISQQQVHTSIATTVSYYRR